MVFQMTCKCLFLSIVNNTDQRSKKFFHHNAFSLEFIPVSSLVRKRKHEEEIAFELFLVIANLTFQ